MPIKEITVKSVMTKSNLPVADFSVNPYVGCTHACAYCYASFMKRFTNHPEPWGTFVDVKNWGPMTRTEKYAGKEAFLGSITDCYQPCEEKYRRTRPLLEELQGSGISISIATKSDLVLRDLDLIKTFPNVRVSFSINTLDDTFRAEMDRAAGAKAKPRIARPEHSEGCAQKKRKIMTEKNEDLRITRTKEAIKKAFKELVCELPYEKITVKAITDKAKINRNTFYLHYTCVDDVLAEIQAKHSSEYSAIVSGFDQLNDTGKLVRAFFEYMEAQDDFFKRVTCDSRFDYIRERMQNKVTKQAAESHPMKGLDQSVRNILLTFNNCIVLLYRRWVADGRKIPMEEMIELATTLLENGMRGFRNN